MKSNKLGIHHKHGHTVAIIIAVVLISMAGMIYFKEYTGHVVGMLNGTAGFVHEINIDASRCTYLWGAINGFAFENPYIVSTQKNFSAGLCNITNYNFDLTCLGDSGTELYFSPVPRVDMNLTLIDNASAWEIDLLVFDNRSYYSDSASKTFLTNSSMNWGGRIIYGKGTKTNSWNGPTGGPYVPAYEMMPLREYFLNCTHWENCTNTTNATGHNVTSCLNITNTSDCNRTTKRIFYGVNLNYSSLNFNGTISNYQALLPIPWGNNSQKYYIFSDPNDFCEVMINYVTGCVNDSVSGEMLTNVTIRLGGGTFYTNESGCYKANATYGVHVLLGN